MLPNSLSPFQDSISAACCVRFSLAFQDAMRAETLAPGERGYFQADAGVFEVLNLLMTRVLLVRKPEAIHMSRRQPASHDCGPRRVSRHRIPRLLARRSGVAPGTRQKYPDLGRRASRNHAACREAPPRRRQIARSADPADSIKHRASASSRGEMLRWKLNRRPLLRRCAPGLDPILSRVEAQIAGT